MVPEGRTSSLSVGTRANARRGVQCGWFELASGIAAPCPVFVDVQDRLRLSSFMAASIAAHGLLSVPGHVERNTQPPVLSAELVYFELSAEPSLPEPLIASVHPATTSSATRAARATRPTRGRPLEPGRKGREPASPERTETPALQPSREAESRTVTQPGAVDLSPLAAASSVFDVRADATSTGPNPRAEARGAPSKSLDQYLREASLNPVLSRSDDPKLMRAKGGGYMFSGNGFNAEVGADGAVRFHDKYGEAHVTFGPQLQPDGTVRYVILKGTFDLTGWAEHLAGNDPYVAERRWFLERTKSLRDEMAVKAITRDIERARIRLRNSLFAIWQDPQRSLWQQKEATFECWNETSDDEVGQHGREVVLRFIDAMCPEGSPRAFTREELRALNARRRLRAPFEPYQTSPRADAH